MGVATYHHGNLRSELLSQAEQVIASGGVEGLSLREVARRAGVSHAAPRAHFATKDDLLDALTALGFERLHAVLQASTTSDASFEEQVRAVSGAYVRFAIDRGALLELMFSMARHRPTAEVTIAESRAYSVFTALLRRGQELGSVVDGSADQIGFPFFAAIHGMAVLAASGTVPPDRQQAAFEDTIRIALRGISPG